ncbi:MAG: CoA transferase [Firmicutes bacterium]|nr:CoA transferase [Bacillota bacterium]
MGERPENEGSPEVPTQVFEGLQLLDLSTGIAGEYCTKLFADFGATVIKVEPREGSPTRRWQQVGEVSPLYSHLNTNKRSITLDPSTATGASILLELAAHADGMVESFGTGVLVLESWGLSWPRLQAINPALVLTRITAFGLNGPYAQDAATQLSLAAMGSAMNSSGRADREPLQKPGHLVSYSVGNTAAVATLGALWMAQRTHTGQQIDVSALEALAEPQAIGQFNERFYPWLMSHTRQEIMSICQEAHLPVLAVYGMRDLLESEHFRTREFWVEQPVADGRPLQFPGPPWRMEGDGCCGTLRLPWVKRP